MGKLINHLIYADDDFCLLSTSKTSLHILLQICDEYALSHGLRYPIEIDTKIISIILSFTKIVFNPVMIKHNTNLSCTKVNT